MMQERYTPGRYRDCRWCGGRGCAACDSEADKDYKEAFPDGPKPIATFRTDTKEGVSDARKFLSELVGECVSEEVLSICRKVNEEAGVGFTETEIETAESRGE